MSFHDPHLLVSAAGRLFAIPGPRILRITRYEEDPEARLDLRRMFGGEATVVGPSTSVVVVSMGPEASIGLLVDEAKAIVTFRKDELIAPPDLGPNVELPYLAALAPSDDSFVLVLDLDHLLAEWKGDA